MCFGNIFTTVFRKQRLPQVAELLPGSVMILLKPSGTCSFSSVGFHIRLLLPPAFSSIPHVQAVEPVAFFLFSIRLLSCFLLELSNPSPFTTPLRFHDTGVIPCFSSPCASTLFAQVLFSSSFVLRSDDLPACQSGTANCNAFRFGPSLSFLLDVLFTCRHHPPFQPHLSLSSFSSCTFPVSFLSFFSFFHSCLLVSVSAARCCFSNYSLAIRPISACSYLLFVFIAIRTFPSVFCSFRFFLSGAACSFFRG